MVPYPLPGSGCKVHCSDRQVADGAIPYRTSCAFPFSGRLERRACPQCKRPRWLSPPILEELVSSYTLASFATNNPKGCELITHIVAFPPHRVAQRFIRLLDLHELLLLLSLRPSAHLRVRSGVLVRVVQQRQPVERLLDLLLRGGAGHAQ